MIAARIALAVSLVGQAQPPVLQPGLPPAPIVSQRVAVLRDWVSAVRRHRPGEADSAALSLEAWSREDVEAAWIDTQVLMHLLRRPAANVFTARPFGRAIVIPREDREAIRTLAIGITRLEGPATFLKRAALLHSDVAMHSSIGDGDAPAFASSMLSPQSFVVQTDDGQQTGLYVGIVHWEFGRILLDALDDPKQDEFVRSWYRATLAYKLAKEELDSPHFDRARALFPDDPVIRFLDGALHYSFSTPAVQAVVRTTRLPVQRTFDVQSEEDELGSAAQEFQRAVSIDPQFTEARLRYGRVLARQGKHNEAAAELRLAVAEVREPLLEYYARLFLGGEEEALGRFAYARALYERAASLYRRAQAPRLALSQLAHRSGDRAEARRALAPTMQPAMEKNVDDDPLWTYEVAAGRFVAEWTEAMYRILEAGAPQ